MIEGNDGHRQENFRTNRPQKPAEGVRPPHSDAQRRKRVIRGEELERLREQYPNVGGDADYVLAWTSRRGNPTFSTMRERQSDGSYRVVGVEELLPKHFSIPAEDMPPAEALQPNSPDMQRAHRRDRELAQTARRMKLDWAQGEHQPLVRSYVQAVVDSEQLQEDLTNQVIPGFSEHAKKYDVAEVLLRAEHSVLTRGLPQKPGLDTWHHMAEKLDVAGRTFGVRVYHPLLPTPPGPSSGVWRTTENHFIPPEESEPPLPLSKRLTAQEDETRARMLAEAERLRIHPDMADMDPALWRLLYHITQASELIATTGRALTQPEEPGLTPAAHTRLRSAHGLNLLVRDILESSLSRTPVTPERAAAGLQQAAAPYGLLIDLQRREQEK
jgi:hypothetical protein